MLSAATNFVHILLPKIIPMLVRNDENVVLALTIF